MKKKLRGAQRKRRAAQKLQAAVSLEAHVDAVRRSVWDRNAEFDESSTEEEWYPIDVLDEGVLVRQGRLLLLVPYTFDDDGVVELGDPRQVEQQLVEVTASVPGAGLVRLLASDAGHKEGWRWRVDVIAPGVALNGDYYPAEVLQESVDLWDGAKVYALRDTGFSHQKDARTKPPEDLVGLIEGPTVEDDGRITADLVFLEQPFADALRTQLVQAWNQGKRDLLGLSIDARGFAVPMVHPEVPGMKRLITEIRAAIGVEMVIVPAAGGKLTELVADHTAAAANHQGVSMDRKKLLELLRARRPDALADLGDNPSTDQILACLTDEDFKALKEGTEGVDPPPVAPVVDPPAAPTAEPVQASANAPVGREEFDAQRVELTTSRVSNMLQASKLPDTIQARLVKRFAGQIASTEQIQAAIDETREMLAEAFPARPAGLGGVREGSGLAGVSIGAEAIDRLQAGFDRAFGLEPEDSALSTIKPITLRGLYNEITRGEDPDVRGQLTADASRAMLQADFTNATLPQVVANTMHRRLTRDYRELDYGEDMLINVVSANDFRSREAIRIGYFGDIPAVDPEAADYVELAAYGEEYESYSVGQKGALVTINRKHIINDDVAAVQKVVTRLGRSARRTFAKFVFNFLTANPAMQDTLAWFHATHGNLLTAALSGAALTTARASMYNQVELSSAEKLALDLYQIFVPIELEDTIININQTDRAVGSANNDANRWFHRFGENNERIHVVPFFSDANDWYVTANPVDAEIIEVAFLQGQREPELFTADQPGVGEMFKADKLQYKIRHEYGGVPVDFRPVLKSAVI